MKPFYSAAAAALLLGACSTSPFTGEEKISNTAIGAGAGAIVGAAAGGIIDGSRKAALIGAGIGALAGGGASNAARESSILSEGARTLVLPVEAGRPDPYAMLGGESPGARCP